MIVNLKNQKSVINSFWITFLFISFLISSCSTPSKKGTESTDKVEVLSNESTENSSDSLAGENSEHPSEHPSNDEGSEHPSENAEGGEHPNDGSSNSEHPQ